MDGQDLIFDKQHKKRVEGLVASIRQLYDKATARFLALAQKVGYKGDVIFSFSDFKDIAKEADDIVRKLSLGMQHVVMRGTDSEWNKGSVSANSTVGRVLRAIGLKEGSLTENAKKIYFDNNQGALKAFQARKISNGETLSKRIWDIANQHKLENELAYSIAHGESADSIAKEIKKLLNEPDRLYRRVRDEFGELQLSKHAKQYNPGGGAYRSSYKNAMRLARTEINMAYRNAEIESYQDKDYVVGYEIHRSTHPYDCDVCESLKGKYPKEFQFNGWHPNCRCYITPILITDEEMAERRKAIISGAEFDSSNSVNAVNDVPDSFKEWVEDNQDRIEAAEERGTLPYFLRDNKEYVDNILASKEESDVDKALRLAKEDYKIFDTELRQQALVYDMDINQEEKDAIYSHGFGRGGYIGTGNSWEINYALRNDGENVDGSEMSEDDRKTVYHLDRVVGRNTASENTMLYRMQSSKWAKNVLGEEYDDSIKKWFREKTDTVDADLSKLLHTTLEDKGFSSTSLSLDRNVFKDYDHPICLELKAPKGTNMYITSNYQESEAILGRGQKMVVVGTRLGEIDDCWGDKQRCLFIECVLV